jgi:uncharacterized protein DUF6353
MKHMVVVYEIEDTEAQELPEIPGGNVKSVHMTYGLTVKHLATDETAFIPYVCWFEEDTSSSWSKPEYEEYNWLFLRSQQNWANDMLRARGHLTLNDVHDTLGMKRTAMGAVVGWTYSKGNEENVVDFGCWHQEGKSFSDAKPGAIMLAFNVQGPILHALG